MTSNQVVANTNTERAPSHCRAYRSSEHDTMFPDLDHTTRRTASVWPCLKSGGQPSMKYM